MNELKYLIKFGFYFMGILFIASSVVDAIGLPITFVISAFLTIWGMANMD